MAEWKDKDLQIGDIDSVKNAISEARNAAMKIGQTMYNQQQSGGSSEQQQNSDSNQQSS